MPPPPPLCFSVGRRTTDATHGLLLREALTQTESEIPRKDKEINTESVNKEKNWGRQTDGALLNHGVPNVLGKRSEKSECPQLGPGLVAASAASPRQVSFPLGHSSRHCRVCPIVIHAE